MQGYQSPSFGNTDYMVYRRLNAGYWSEPINLANDKANIYYNKDFVPLNLLDSTEYGAWFRVLLFNNPIKFAGLINIERSWYTGRPSQQLIYINFDESAIYKLNSLYTQYNSYDQARKMRFLCNTTESQYAIDIYISASNRANFRANTYIPSYLDIMGRGTRLNITSPCIKVSNDYTGWTLCQEIDLTIDPLRSKLDQLSFESSASTFNDYLIDICGQIYNKIGYYSSASVYTVWTNHSYSYWNVYITSSALVGTLFDSVNIYHLTYNCSSGTIIALKKVDLIDP